MLIRDILRPECELLPVAARRSIHFDSEMLEDSQIPSQSEALTSPDEIGVP